jgi:hypothetical protein
MPEQVPQINLKKKQPKKNQIRRYKILAIKLMKMVASSDWRWVFFLTTTSPYL